MNGLASSVNRFRFRIGATVAFDADDARQEASLAMWLAGDDRAVVGYRAILDALRRLGPGFRTKDQPEMCDELPEQISADTPDGLLEAAQLAARIAALNDRHRAVIEAFAAGETGAEIAQRLGVSEPRVYQIKGDALRAANLLKPQANK